MNEYQLRKSISNSINDIIYEKIKNYYEKYQNNIGFLLFYPLIRLEQTFRRNDPHFESVIPDRLATGWFIKELIKLNYKQNLQFKYNHNEYLEFESMFKDIYRMYSDYIFTTELLDSNSIAQYKIVEENNKYRIISSLVSNKYREESAYYYGMFDTSKYTKEREIIKKPIEYIGRHFLPNLSGIKKLKKYVIDVVDLNLLELCEERVSIDIDKMGPKIKSKIIKNPEEVKKIVSFLYYIAALTNTQQLIYLYYGNDDYSSYYFPINENKLVKKMTQVTGLSNNSIKKYLDYMDFNSKHEGSLIDFPLFKYKQQYIITPSSIMLNDWQFSLVNGHYNKGLDFKDRHKNISETVVLDIVNKGNGFQNTITCCGELCKYTLKDETGKIIRDEKGNPIGSDIDVGIYDIDSDTLLIIECKWKDNHYDLYNENYRKIHSTIYEIYDNQLSLHKRLLENKPDNIKYVFNNNPIVSKISVNTKIHYIAIDKRSQYHTDNKHMLSVYLLMTLMDKYSEDNKLYLDKMVKEINSLETRVEHFHIDDLKEFKFNDVNILSDDLYLNYNLL